ncbi:MAG: ribonuclease HII [bacterium]|nr:ribonuclease HII [bacterium]
MLSPSLKEEQKLWRKGYAFVAGVDEVGRGAWAGPLVVGAVIFFRGARTIVGVRDSKLLTPAAREKLFPLIIENVAAWAVGVVSQRIIDRIGIVAANRQAMCLALENLSHPPDYVLTDAFALQWKVPVVAVPDGDGRVESIAAASIIAKVWRDRLMRKLHRRYPQYSFDQHKGYGTALHEQAIRRYGLCALHRRSFVPPRCFLKI